MSKKFKCMLEANQITHEILMGCKKLILNAKSITPFEVNQYAMFIMTRKQVIPAFLNYKGFPFAMCISINDAVCHGIPSKTYKIKKGDIVSLDFGVKVDGYCADAAITFINNNENLLTALSPSLKEKKRLVENTKKALDEAVEALKKSFPNCKISDITKEIDKYKNKFAIIYGYGGHGIGKDVHESNIFIPNYLDEGFKDKTLVSGDYFTIEPMFAIGEGIIDTYVDEEDNNTIRTIDSSLSAHFEYSLTINKNGVTVLK